MLKKYISLILIGVLYIFLSNAEAKDPCKIEQALINGDSFLIFTSLVDSLDITSININRGNCGPVTFGEEAKGFEVLVKAFGYHGIEEIDKVCKNIKYGNTCKIWIVCDRVLEIEISTNHGNYLFKNNDL